MPTYKTKDGTDRILPGIGRTVGGLITTDFKIENPMFELVSEGEAPAQVAQATAPDKAVPAAPPAPQAPAAPAQPSPEEVAAGVIDNKQPNEETA